MCCALCMELRFCSTDHDLFSFNQHWLRWHARPPQPRFLNSVYNQYPDDNSEKVVQLQAAGLTYPGYGARHVILQWVNGIADGQRVTQILQLTGQPGNYAYFVPLAKIQPDPWWADDEVFDLGSFTRSQRDHILARAKAIVFDRRSIVNSCRTWTRDLLEAMVGEGLLTKNAFDEIDTRVPLLKRQPEIPSEVFAGDDFDAPDVVSTTPENRGFGNVQSARWHS